MIQQLLPEEAADLIGQESVIIVDVRDDEAYLSSHIEGAVQLSIPELAIFCAQTAKDQAILVYCYHGISSQSVAQHLQDQGFVNLYSLVGGYEKWQAYHNSTSDRSTE